MKNPNREQAKAYCQKAIEFIDIVDALPVPPNYDLFFQYAARSNEALNKIFDERLAAGGSMSASELKMLYDGYATGSEDDERFSLLGERLGEEIQDALGLVEQAVESTSEFGGSLAHVQTELGDFSDVDKIKSVFKVLVQATKEMEKSSGTLQQQLTETTHQIEQLQHDLDHVRLESQTDFLTGVANRKCFDQTLEKEVAKAKLMEKPLCLGMVDVDHFKKFNDTYGHPVGDSVLRMVATMLKNGSRDADLAARYGGEEFTFIMPDTKLDVGIKVADRIRRALSSKELVKRSSGEKLGFITVSIGVSSFRRDDTPESMIERADRCLYAAKNAGRNRVVDESDACVADKSESAKVA